ncbi:MAG: DUF2785 domain-containing protein [bacterium]|nr:DUF2785 domain-containing protein [bacterium]
MGNLESLKKVLNEIKENDYQVSNGVNKEEVIFEMLDHIGYPEYELREKLIYHTFYNWIVKKPELSKSVLKDVLKIGLDDSHLFYKIGQKNNNSVHTRTSSVLLVPLILIIHREQNLLNKEEILNVFHKVTHYFLEEADLRGYIEDDGWAHSVAHTADALDDLALCSEIGYNELKYMLEIIQIKICVGNYVYIDEEDERIVTAIISILGRNLIPLEEICLWIRSFGEMTNPHSFRYKDDMRINIKNFLRSLYFRLMEKQEMNDIVLIIKEVLNKISKFLL